MATAANFLSTAREIAHAFTAVTGHAVVLSGGSTGGLYAQIVHGAPYDLFLAADAERPERLEAAGLAVAGTRVTYAVGRLTLWSPSGAPLPEALREGRFRRLALANPRTAPYGRAALEVTRRLGLSEDALEGRMVLGEDVAQAYQLVATGNADLGFVASSHLRLARDVAGTTWAAPAGWHAPLEQQVVLLERSRDRRPAQAFWTFLRSEEAQRLVAAAGYGRAEVGP